MVLVHGAGDTAAVWKKVQHELPVPSVVLDLPGRGRNPSDLSRVTVDLAVRQAVTDIVELMSGPIVLVAHSAGGAVSPGILAELGDRVFHLVHMRDLVHERCRGVARPEISVMRE
jgi:pimeloyl-ACP methyl ester carboxylesterase